MDLRRFGLQRPPDGPIATLDYVPNPGEFYRDYVLPRRPVMFKGAQAKYVLHTLVRRPPCPYYSPCASIKSRRGLGLDSSGVAVVDHEFKRTLFRRSVAVRNWTDSYLRDHYGHNQVLIEAKYENRNNDPRRTSLARFLQT